LEREQESPLDAILVQRVKINRIVEKANLALVRNKVPEGLRSIATDLTCSQSYHATFEEDGASAALPSIYVQSMQVDLDRLKHELPHHLQQNGQ
jgi:hypothetical protein